MIRREPKKPVVVSCDGCGVVHKNSLRNYPAFSYKHTWEAAKADGWTAKKDDSGKDWKHCCSECSGGK